MSVRPGEFFFGFFSFIERLLKSKGCEIFNDKDPE
jgi:hypothetical protein